MDGYKARLLINGKPTEGAGTFSCSDGKATLFASFPGEKTLRSVAFVPEEEVCFLEKRGELTVRARLVPGEESEMVCETPYGEMRIPVHTLQYRYQSTENRIMLWLSYVLPYLETAGERASPLARESGAPGHGAFATNDEEKAADLEEAAIGEKVSLFFSLEKKTSVCRAEYFGDTLFKE